MSKYVPEPFRIKMVEKIKILTADERAEKIKEANYNLFNLKSEDVYIDLLSDSGTGAMSSEQWSGMMLGDEAYAGSSSFFKLEAAGRDIFGYDYIQPVHQGRAAEKVLFPMFLGKGKYAISNTFFDTTRLTIMVVTKIAFYNIRTFFSLRFQHPKRATHHTHKAQPTFFHIASHMTGLTIFNHRPTHASSHTRRFVAMTAK